MRAMLSIMRSESAPVWVNSLMRAAVSAVRLEALAGQPNWPVAARSLDIEGIAYVYEQKTLR